MISPSTLGAAAGLASAALDVAEAAGKAAAKTTSRKSPGGVASVLAQAAPALAKAAIAGLAKPKPSRATGKARASRSRGAGYARSTSRATTSKAGSTSKASDPLSFLKDPRLSIEEKLMRLLAHLNEKWEKDMQKKMEEIAGKSSAPKSTSKKKAGGLLGSIGNVLKGALPQMGIVLEALKNPTVRGLLSKIGGPALAAGATAAGFPQLAPLLLRYGPKVVELAAGVASSVDAAAGSSTSSAQASAAGENGKTEQLQMMELQRMFEKQKEMFSLVSNMLKSGHDTRMAVINNVR
ncbi:MAG TPA: hypothetical protein VGB87_19190 [Vicinamibacteria bacterium]